MLEVQREGVCWPDTPALTPQQRFTRVAHAFEANEEILRKIHGEIATIVRPGDTVLDIGCGQGMQLEAARARGAKRGIGIDFDPACIDVVRAKGFEGHLGRVQDFDMEPGSVDVITMIHIIEHVHPQEALELITKAGSWLAPRGRIFLLTPNISHPPVQSIFWIDVTHVRPYPDQVLGAMLASLPLAGWQTGVLNVCLPDTFAYGFSDARDRLHPDMDLDVLLTKMIERGLGNLVVRPVEEAVMRLSSRLGDEAQGLDLDALLGEMVAGGDAKAAEALKRAVEEFTPKRA